MRILLLGVLFLVPIRLQAAPLPSGGEAPQPLVLIQPTETETSYVNPWDVGIPILIDENGTSVSAKMYWGDHLPSIRQISRM